MVRVAANPDPAGELRRSGEFFGLLCEIPDKIPMPTPVSVDSPQAGSPYWQPKACRLRRR
jgi:hypothetical protein